MRIYHIPTNFIYITGYYILQLMYVCGILCTEREPMELVHMSFSESVGSNASRLQMLKSMLVIFSEFNSVCSVQICAFFGFDFEIWSNVIEICQRHRVQISGAISF